MSETVEPVAPDVEAPAAPEPSPAADLRSALSAAFDEAEKAAGGEGEGQQRDERGRFVGAASNEEAPEAEAQPEAPQEEAKAPEPAAPVVPPEVAAIQPVLERYKPLYAARGVSADQAMAALFEAQKVLEERPREAIEVLARQYGVDLRSFAPATPAPAQPQAPQTNDPAMAAVLAEVQQLRQYVTTQQQQAVAAENARVEQTIQAFASDPKHSHFPAVRHLMGGLMQAAEAKGEPMTMAEAYEAACRAHPTVYQAIQKAEAETKAKAEQEARAKAAAEAKAKAVSVRGNVPVPGNRAAPSSRRGLIEAAYEGRLN